MSNAQVYADGPKLWRVELTEPPRDKVGWIEERNDGRFHIIVDDDPSSTSPLWGVDHGPHGTINDAMAAVAYRLGGTCEERQS